jgi:hypothetical protein
MRKVLSDELDNFESLEKVDLFNEEKTLIGKLFNRVFRSQKQNMDQIVFIVAHVFNKLGSSPISDGQSNSTTASLS